MKVELFVSDLDGTLLNREHKISQRTAEAVRMAQSKGIRWIIATGRSWGTALPLLEEAGLKTDFILLNGAEFRAEDGTLIFENPIDQKIAKKLISYLLDQNMDVEVNTSAGDFSTNLEVCSTAREFPELSEFWSQNPKILKIFAFLTDDLERVNQVKASLNELNGVSVTSSAAWNIEITASEAQKGIMLNQVAEKYEINKESIVLFGDGENDKSMFQRFIHTCAMENSVHEIFGLAKKVVGSNMEDGLAKEVERILFSL